MIASTQITNSQVFAFIVVPVFMLLGRKVLFINRKTIDTVEKWATFKRYTSADMKFY